VGLLVERVILDDVYATSNPTAEEPFPRLIPLGKQRLAPNYAVADDEIPLARSLRDELSDGWKNNWPSVDFYYCADPLSTRPVEDGESRRTMIFLAPIDNYQQPLRHIRDRVAQSHRLVAPQPDPRHRVRTVKAFTKLLGNYPEPLANVDWLPRYLPHDALGTNGVIYCRFPPRPDPMAYHRLCL
jgi:hypothetical protein